MMIAGLKDIEHMFSEGRFAAALAALGDREPSNPQQAILFAEALDETGSSERAGQILERLLTSSQFAQAHHPSALRALAAVAFNLGDTSKAYDSLRKALSIAEREGLVEEAAQAALRLFSLLSNRHGPGPAAPVLAVAKKYVLRSSSKRLYAELHSRVGQADAQESSYRSARRHLSLALDVLRTTPHFGISARTNLALSSTHALIADNDRAVQLAASALGDAEASGSQRLNLLCRANLAQLQLRADDLSHSLQNAKGVLRQVQPGSTLRLAVLETVVAASLEIEEGDNDSERHEFTSLMTEASDESWISVEAVPTLVRLYLSLLQKEHALNVLESGIGRSRSRANTSNTMRLQVLRAEILALEGDQQRAWRELVELDSLFSIDTSADILALSERVKGILLYAEGARRLARQHFSRSERVFRRCGLRLEARRTRTTRNRLLENRAERSRLSPRQSGQRESAAATLFFSRLSGYPHILAREVIRYVSEQGIGQASAGGSGHTGVSQNDGVHIKLGSHDGRDVSVGLVAADQPRTQQMMSTLADVLARSVALQAVAQSGERLEHFWDIDTSSDGKCGLYVSSEMKSLLRSAQQVARTDLPILILGETGTGKEILAAEIHACSGRSKLPFIPFNVTAVSRELLESQLFGAKRGSFTGATQDTPGLIREAEGGTIFLDEIGEMSLELQPKLLRFVEQGEIQPVGERPQQVDVRIIAATNASLHDLVRQGRFREDLYHRLRVVPLTIPPLRDRREEIPTLARHFVATHAARAKRAVPDIAPRAVEHLVAADWPGNVRQLNNELKRVVALLPEGENIDVQHLSPDLQRPAAPQPLVFDTPGGRLAVNLDRPLELVVDEVERAAIERVMAVTSGNISEAARRLGMTRKGLYLKRKRLGMDPA